MRHSVVGVNIGNWSSILGATFLWALISVCWLIGRSLSHQSEFPKSWDTSILLSEHLFKWLAVDNPASEGLIVRSTIIITVSEIQPFRMRDLRPSLENTFKNTTVFCYSYPNICFGCKMHSNNGIIFK